MHDSKEFSGVGKSILGINEQNHYDRTPYGKAEYLGDTSFSHSSSKPLNAIAYGSDGKAFGVVPKDLIDQIEQSTNNWSSKNLAIESIYDIVQEASAIQNILAYAPSFLKYLCKILNNETNTKIVSNILKIINKVLSFDEVSYKINDQLLVSNLVKKLADSNIQIRQLVLQSFLIIMKHCKQNVYLNMLLPYLGSTSWHIREEVLHLILVSFLKSKNDIDYYAVVDPIAKLLDDPKSTVRFTCRETIAALVFKGDKKKV